MSVVVRKDANGKAVYWIVFSWEKRQIWERVGREKREATRLEAVRRSEVKEGTYRPREHVGMTVADYIEVWCATRSTRNAAREEALLLKHVASKPFGAKQIRRVRTPDVMDFLAELKTTVSTATKARISTKHVANIYGLVRTMFRYARRREVIESDPFEGMEAKAVDRRVTNKRRAYAVSDFLALVGDKVQVDRRVWNALALFTGMREGEVCGRRWRNLDRSSQPLASLDVNTQWNDEPMKTDSARIVPVHPELGQLLDWWWAEGFEFVHCRKPTKDDLIVPRRGDEGRHAHTSSTAYKQWLTSCGEAGVTNLSVHSTRHTFISFCRRGGARKEIVEKITHNAKGDIVDQYTHMDWAPLCEAVQMLTETLKAPIPKPFSSAEGGSRTLASTGDSREQRGMVGNFEGSSDSEEFPRMPQVGGRYCAGQENTVLVGADFDALAQRSAEDEQDAAALALTLATEAAK